MILVFSYPTKVTQEEEERKLGQKFILALISLMGVGGGGGGRGLNCVIMKCHFCKQFLFVQSFAMRKSFFNHEEKGFFKVEKRESQAKNPMTGLYFVFSSVTF